MRTIRRLMALALSHLVDIEGGSQSIEDWAKAIVRAHDRGKGRPEVVVLILERYGECYRGKVFITHEDFNGKEEDLGI